MREVIARLLWRSAAVRRTLRRRLLGQAHVVIARDYLGGSHVLYRNWRGELKHIKEVRNMGLLELVQFIRG